MKEDATSTRLDDGSIGCSRCKLSLTKARSPFYIRKEYVGHFDSLDCPLCHFHIFTEKGYDNAMQMAYRCGLVGPPEEVETCEATHDQDAAVEPITSRVVEERLTIMTVQSQASIHQFVEGDNHKINYDRDENTGVLKGLLDTPIVPVQSSLKAMGHLIVVDVK